MEIVMEQELRDRFARLTGALDRQKDDCSATQLFLVALAARLLDKGALDQADFDIMLDDVDTCLEPLLAGVAHREIAAARITDRVSFLVDLARTEDPPNTD